jgi:DNA-binding response OmpR family regulator
MPSSTDRAPRILIVDDQVSNVRLLDHTLRRAGYVEIMSTIESPEVAALHALHHYDLILLDLQMPRMSGFEVMRELSAIRGVKRAAILVLSADPSEMMAALEAGANSFISKPFKLPDLVARVQALLESVIRTEVDEPAPLERDDPRLNI